MNAAVWVVVGIGAPAYGLMLYASVRGYGALLRAEWQSKGVPQRRHRLLTWVIVLLWALIGVGAAIGSALDSGFRFLGFAIGAGIGAVTWLIGVFAARGAARARHAKSQPDARQLPTMPPS